MKGLLLKDILLLKKQGKIIIIFLILFSVLSTVMKIDTMFTSFMSAICATLPITALSYDEKAKWDKYALSMPVSRTDLVISKYILGFLFSLITLIFNVIFYAVNQSDLNQISLAALIAFGFGIVFISVILPVFFKFGTEKGRIIMIILFFTPTFLFMFLSQLKIPMPDINSLISAAYFIPLLAIPLLLVSLWISFGIYKNKEM